jgi:hypothetical protein
MINNNLLSTRDIYIYYVIKCNRKRINNKLKSLETLHKKKKFLKKFFNPRHVDFIHKEGLCDFSFKQYKEVLKLMNKKCIDEVISGESLHLKNYLGYLYIKKFERDFKLSENGEYNTRKDWKASLEKRDQLIKEGKTPLKKFKDNVNKIIGDNGGVPWIVYRLESDIYRFCWNKTKFKHVDSNDTVYPLKNITPYFFKPTKENRIQLSRYLEKSENLELI